MESEFCRVFEVIRPITKEISSYSKFTFYSTTEQILSRILGNLYLYLIVLKQSQDLINLKLDSIKPQII